MTRTAFFNEPVTANGATGGRRAPASSASSFLRKLLNAAQFVLPGTATVAEASAQPYPWLTANIRRNMSARSQRLIRADY